MSCHDVVADSRIEADVRIALAGNPNVGKSALFNRLTGLSAVTANYPGKTVELNIGLVKHRKKRIAVVDLPGTYGLDALSEDQKVAKTALLSDKYDVVVLVVDASNLERNLYQALQLLELQLPVVIALNMIDYAAKKGTTIDESQLEQTLGVPVVPIIAITGFGVKRLLDTIVSRVERNVAANDSGARSFTAYSELINELGKAVLESTEPLRHLQLPGGFYRRLVEGDADLEAELQKIEEGRDIVKIARALRIAVELKENQAAQVVFAKSRQDFAHSAASSATRRMNLREEAAVLGRHYAVWAPTAIPLMFGVMVGVFGFMFFAGGFLSDLIGGLWASKVSPVLQFLTVSAVRNELLARVLLWGFDGGILAALSVGVPFVLTFYFVLAILEDTGYLGNIAYVTDNVMRKIGLHGRSIIPLVMGLGCNVPAIMATRVLSSRRERLLASTLITLTPCSARIAVVLGAVGYFVGWQWAVLIFLADLAVIGAIGKALNLIMPGESSGFVMEMFPLHFPSLRTILNKTWFRFKAFAYVAFPIVTLGSLLLGGLYELGFLNLLTQVAGPSMYMLLGLPPVAAIALILGILRKELTLQLLVALAVMQYGPSAQNLTLFMSATQLFVFALVVTLYFPCVATMSVLGREMGWKSTAVIMVGDIGIALAAGALAFHAMSLPQFV